MNNIAERQTSGWVSLLDRLWRILAWIRLTVILLVWVAAVLALSAVIPQAPPHIEDPIVHSQWLANLPISARPAVERLQPLGVFNLLDSVWLRLPLALLLAHALVMLADLGPAVWRRARWSLDELSSLGKSFQFDRDLPDPVEHVSQQFISRLGKAGYRVSSPQRGDISGQGQKDFIAWRWRWSWLGLAGIYLGLGLASVGLILGSWLGQAQGVNLEPDSPMPLPAADALNVVLEKVTVPGGNPLKPATGVASMSILTGVGESQRLTMRLHSSRLLRGMWLTLADLRPMAEVTAVDAETGENVLLQPFSPRTPAQEWVRLPLIGDPEMRFVGVPSQNVTLHVDYQIDDEDRHPAFAFSLFRGAEPHSSHSATLGSGEKVAFDGVYYLITFDYDVMLRVNSALWWVTVAVGWGVVVLSFIVLTVAPPVYVQGSAESTRKGSRLTLAVDVLGDEQRRHRELKALITPDI